MGYFQLCALGGFLIAGGTGIFVCLKRKDALGKVLSLLLISSAIWSLGLFLMITPASLKAARVGAFLHGAAAAIPAFYLHFVVMLINRQKKIVKIAYAAGFLILIFVPSTFFVERLVPKGGFNFYPEPGIVYHLFTINFWVWVLWALKLLWSEYKRSPAAKAIQLKYIILASLMGFIGGGSAFFLDYNLPVPPYPLILFTLHPLILAYALIRYHLVDINIVMRRTTLLLCGIFIPVAGIFVVLYVLQMRLAKSPGSSWWLLTNICVALLTFWVFWFTTYITRQAEKRLYPALKMHCRFREYLEDISKMRTIDELLDFVLRSIFSFEKSEVCAVAVKVRKNIILKELIDRVEFYKIVNVIGSSAGTVDLKERVIEQRTPLIEYIMKRKNFIEKGYLLHLLKQNISLEDKKRYRSVVEQLNELKAELVVPVYFGENLISLFFFGQKPDETRFSLEEIDLIVTFINQAAKPIAEFMTYEENIRLILAACRATLAALEEKDHYTRGHCERVKEYCLLLAGDESVGRRLKEIPDGLRGLELAAELHDIGKIGIPDAILNKPGRLEEKEFDVIKMHPQKAVQILGELGAWLSENVIYGILHHQENYDGTGYPFGLKGERIHPYAQIIRVADTIDAMTSKRPYRPALPMERAVEEIKANAGTLYSPFVVEAMINLYNQGKLIALVSQRRLMKSVVG